MSNENIGDIANVTITGRITDKGIKLGETRYNTPKAEFSLQVNKCRQSSDGSYKSKTEYHFVTVYDAAVLEIAGMLEAGQQVTIGGELTRDSWKDPKTNAWCDKTYIIARSITVSTPPELPQLAPAPLTTSEMTASRKPKSKATAMAGAAEPKFGVRNRVVTHEA